MAKSPHLSKTEVDITVDTHTTGDTLKPGIHSHWGRRVRWQWSGEFEAQENGGGLLFLGFLDFSIVVFYLFIRFFTLV